ncbi:hypothetical protein [Caldimonas tepidiphila]|uniref:hypothetical protein n=1 Tax=Caldimonas tepidiphila TaxID=2315841 RepID=UPI001F0CA357|nr:hypothetical protein [Caldimonas tepidiphila]
MPPLPVDIGAAGSRDAETALAFAIEAARVARQQAAPAGAEVRQLFIAALAQLIGAALRPSGGDPAFQALVLRAQEAEVDEHVRLAAQAAADLRAVRLAIDAIAHPGKLHRMAPGAMREALSRLHALAAAGSWSGLKRALGQLTAQQESLEDACLRAALEALRASPGLERLERGQALLAREAVQRYRALCARRGPLAGSEAAAARGRAAARLGADAETCTVQAFQAMAELLGRRQSVPVRYRVVQGLRTPGGFPGATDKAKEEWDAAIVRQPQAGGAAEIVLLAEVKASPAAAASDFPRLVRGLHRLAQAHADAEYAFASPEGVVHLSGASLRRLQPRAGDSLPPAVGYCCTAPPEPQVPLLSPAGKAMLLAEPASVAFARESLRSGPQDPEALAPVWEALSTASRMHPVLHQYETARSVREAMLHPQDLLSALERAGDPREA